MILELDLLINSDRLTASDKTINLADMEWDDYERVIQSNNSNYRIDYFKNIISIVSPSRNHERIAQTIIVLINAYCRKYGIKYFALGSSDIKKPPIAGKQPDASYCFETEKEIPDLAVEVVFSSGGMADLNKYQALNVREVWFWQQNQLKIYQLKNGKYSSSTISINLTQLQVKLLSQYINRGLREDQLTIETEFTKVI